MAPRAPVVSGDVVLEWVEADRIARMSFRGPRATATEDDAAACLATLDAWFGEEEALLLVDCTGLVDAEAGWRAAFGRRARERRMRLAWHSMSPLIGMMVRMFLLATRAQGRGFDDEASARAWLVGERS